MRRSVVLALLTVAGMASAVVPSAGAAIPGGAPQAVQHKLTRSCGDPAPGEVACKAVLDTPVTNTGQVVEQVVTRAIAPSGYGPADLTSAYKLPVRNGWQRPDGGRRGRL
jgi:hypothetical protein